MEKQIEPFITIPDFVKKKTVPLGETKIYNLIHEGKIQGYRVGRKIFVIESEVHAAIKRMNMRVYGRAGLR